MKKSLKLTAVLLAAASLPLVALAAETPAQQQAATAQAHAMMAENATTLKMAHTHLHHAINCLVGPKGHGFDAAAADPCKGQGNGALPDSSSDAALHAKLETALNQAQTGLKTTTLTTAHTDAAKVAATLQDTGTPAKKASGGYSW
ncbi:MAG TPA: hypothetical protein VFQ88_00485 [Nevskiaceae bacterium]|nr:hypothetical protein [Nevskiaceae bacterium]